MDLQEQYKRIQKLKQTPEIVSIRERIAVFIHKTQHVEMLADQLSRQVEELERMSEELVKEEIEICEMISRTIK